MSAYVHDERTEPATPRRRREARESGNVWRSPELSAAVVVGGGLLLLAAVFGSVDLERWLGLRDSWGDLSRPLTLETVTAAGVAGLRLWLALAALALVPLLVLVTAVNLLQTGFVFTWQPLRPELERVNPGAGARRLASGRSCGRIGFRLLQLGLVVGVALHGLWRLVEIPGGISTLFEPDLATRWLLHILPGLGLELGVALIALGVLDVLLQRARWERQLRMSRTEIQDERKRTEGDPTLAGRRRRLRRRFAAEPRPAGGEA